MNSDIGMGKRIEYNVYELMWTSVIVSELIQIISINMVPCYSLIKHDMSRQHLRS